MRSAGYVDNRSRRKCDVLPVRRHGTADEGSESHRIRDNWQVLRRVPLLQQTHDVDLDLEDFGGSLPDGFSAIWTGAIYIDDPGNVTFFLDNTDYSDLYIDDTYVSSHNSGSGRTKSDGDQVSLTGGWHTITVDFIDYNDEPENDLILKYDTGTGEVVIPPDALFTTQVTTIDYDAVGRVESIIDPNGNETDYLYDNADRLTSETITVDFVPLTRSYIYDDNGNLTQLTDRDGPPPPTSTTNSIA